MKTPVKVIRGNFVHAAEKDALEICEDAYCIVESGCVREMLRELPDAFSGIPVVDTRPGNR